MYILHIYYNNSAIYEFPFLVMVFCSVGYTTVVGEYRRKLYPPRRHGMVRFRRLRHEIIYYYEYNIILTAIKKEMKLWGWKKTQCFVPAIGLWIKYTNYYCAKCTMDIRDYFTIYYYEFNDLWSMKTVIIVL